MGLLVEWPDDNEYPENGDWVVAVGTLSRIERDGARLVGVHLSSLTVYDEPGVRHVGRLQNADQR